MPSVMVIEQGRAQAAGLPLTLQAAGYELLAMLPLSWLRAATTDYAADIAVFLADDLDPVLIASIAQFYRRRPRPIALSMRRAEPGMMEEAVRAGVSAIAASEQFHARIRLILENAVARFEAMRPPARDDWEEYKEVERAKGILMRRRGLTEARAESALHVMATRQAKSVAQVAATIVEAETQLKRT